MTQEQRLEKIQAMPDDTMFFFQSYGFVGNAINFWAKDSKGYTTNPYEAHQFTKQEAIGQLKCNRDQDTFWPVKHILENVSQFVDAQYVNRRESV